MSNANSTPNTPNNGPTLSDVAQMYIIVWLACFGLTFPLTLIVNGLFGVPLAQPVNVFLALTLFVAYAFVAVCLVTAAQAAVRGRFITVLFALICAVLGLGFPFAEIAAFRLYAWLGGIALAGTDPSGPFIMRQFEQNIGAAVVAIFPDVGIASLEITIAAFLVTVIAYLNSNFAKALGGLIGRSPGAKSDDRK